MARIAGVNIPLNKRVEIGLTYIYGIGRPTSNETSPKLGIEPGLATSVTSPTANLPAARHDRPATTWSRATCVASAPQAIKRLMEIGCYRGIRHRRGLPVRGQNTKTNARTRKGPKRMQVAGKKKAGKK